MSMYKVTLISGQTLSIEADGVEFGPGHVVFWGPAGTEVVRALLTPAVAEVVQEPDE